MSTKLEDLFIIIACLIIACSLVFLIVVLAESNGVKTPIFVNEAKVLNIDGDTLIITRHGNGKSMKLEIRKKQK